MFQELKSKASPPRRFFKADWSAEEKAFLENLPSFLGEIEAANPAGPCTSTIPRHEPKKEEIRQEQPAKELIIGTDTADAPFRGASAMRRPEESVVREEDPFDVLTSPPVAAQAKTELAPKPEGAPAVSPEPDPFESASGSPSSKGFPPEEKKAEGANAEPQANPFLDGLDVTRFQRDVKATGEEILSRIPDVNLKVLEASLPKYSICLNIDSQRETPESLGEKMARVQALMDSLHVDFQQLKLMVEGLDQAMDFILNNGVLCSSASSRE